MKLSILILINFNLSSLAAFEVVSAAALVAVLGSGAQSKVSFKLISFPTLDFKAVAFEGDYAGAEAYNCQSAKLNGV